MLDETLETKYSLIKLIPSRQFYHQSATFSASTVLTASHCEWRVATAGTERHTEESVAPNKVPTLNEDLI